MPPNQKYRRYTRKQKQNLPVRHDHVGHMIFDGDFACCRVCEQAWQMTERGWKPLPKREIETYE